MRSRFLYNTWRNITRKFDAEGLVPVSRLVGIVGSPSWFSKCLIGKTINMQWVVYIKEKCMHLSKTRTCTIIECVIILNVR